MRVILTKEECHQNLSDLCDLVAEKVGLKVTDKTRYDPKKWCVSPDVQSEYFAYAREAYPEMSDETLGVLWVCYGPKANVGDVSPDEPYVVEVEEEFAVNP